jgi:hypothetical protein
MRVDPGREVMINRAALALAAAIVASAIAVSVAHAGSILTQGQLIAELGTSCAAQGKTAPCITPTQMSDLVTTAVPLVSSGIAAAGASQGTATALAGQISDVTTVPAGSGVILPAAVAGQVNLVCDEANLQLLVYPASGASIGTLAANAPQAVPAGLCAQFTALSATAWKIAFSSAPAAAGFYVSASGSDNNPGTLALPFLTLGKCQTAMQGSSNKTCYLRAGTYPMSAGLTLNSADAGETWTYYPPDGVASPTLTQTAAFAFFQLNTGADNVTINGLGATGFQSSAHSSCFNASEAAFVLGGQNAGNNGGPNNTTITNNVLSTFDCGVDINESSNPVISFNRASTSSYVAFGCGHCTGAAGQSIWQSNIIYDLNAGGAQNTNAYGIVFTTTSNGGPSNFTAQNNIGFNSTWEIYDAHGGTNISFLNNLCVGPGGTGGNAACIQVQAPSSSFPVSNVVMSGNIADNGYNNTTANANAYVECGSAGCASNASITGGSIQNNTTMFGTANGCVIFASPVVNVSGNTCALNPEQVSSIKFAGGATSATGTHGQPAAVVASLAVNMSAAVWAFPAPPGTLAIGGTNSGGFVICNQTQICQPAAGAAAGTYSDFTIAATLHGMLNSPFTAAAGSLTVTMQ